MNFFHSFVGFIDTLGVVQGLLFGTTLIFLNAKKHEPTLFLGLFIILFSLEPLPNILQDLGILDTYPRLELLPVNFHFLAFPLFYIYVQKISILKNQKPSYWTLWPGIVEFIGAMVIFMLPVATKSALKGSSFTIIYFTLGLCYSIYIGILILKWITMHISEINQQYSKTSDKTLHWAKWFIYASVGFQSLLLVSNFSANPELYLFVSILNVLLIYWVSFQGFVQHQVRVLIREDSTPKNLAAGNWEPELVLRETEASKTTPEQKHGFMTAQNITETLETVKEYVNSSECYIVGDLTISDVAEAVNIHPKRISHALNSKPGINFNNYINSLRVEKAKELLKSDAVKHLSVEGIGSEVGFHSKTTFYSAFKKFENMTPAQFRNS